MWVLGHIMIMILIIKPYLKWIFSPNVYINDFDKYQQPQATTL